jgi:hypothetical protein
VKEFRGDPALIGRSQTADLPDSGSDPDAERAHAGEKQQAEAAAEVGRADARPAISWMAQAFSGAEHTSLYVITSLLCSALSLGSRSRSGVPIRLELVL